MQFESNGSMKTRGFVERELECARALSSCRGDDARLDEADAELADLRQNVAEWRNERAAMLGEITAVLEILDGVARQWGDEGVFRRCRDRLRVLVQGA